MQPLAMRPKLAPQGKAMADGLDGLERKLDVRRRARADAANGAPALEAHDLSALERDVLARAGAAQARFAAARLSAAQALEAKLRRLAPGPVDLDGPAASATLEIARVEGRAKPDTRKAAQAAHAALAALDGFREAHGLSRPAIYPKAAVLSLALVLLAALFEATFSAGLFADIDPLGWVGGAGKAVGLSLANVALGFLAGYLGLRYLGHRRMALRAAGVAALLALTAAGLGLTLFAAQWRDHAEAPAAAARLEAEAQAAASDHDQCLARARKRGDDAAAGLDCRAGAEFQQCLARADEATCLREDAFKTCRANRAKAMQAQSAAQACAETYAQKLDALRAPAPQFAFLPVATPQALILLMLGAAVFLFAALKGYSGVDDPYPDYGKLDRANARAQAQASAVRADARDELEAAVVAAEKALAERLAPLAAALTAQRAAFEAGAAEIAALDVRARAAAHEAGSAIALYRRENAAARAGPAPAYFADPPTPDVHLPDVLGPAGALLTASEDALTAARGRVGALLADLAVALDAADSRLETA